MLEKKEIANKMLQNARQSLLDTKVKKDFYLFIASQCKDPKESAQWKVEADKTNVAKRDAEDLVERLEAFTKQYEPEAE